MRRRFEPRCSCEARLLGKASNSLPALCFRDAERKRKVKELLGSLGTQEGEWKALKRRKRK